MTKVGRPSHRDNVLAAMPGTRSQLSRKSGVSSSTVGKWVAILRAEGMAHVGGWRRAPKGGSKQPVYVAGPGQDKTPPRTLTDKQQQERFRKRNPGRCAEINRKHYRLARLREHGHGFLAALFF